MWDPISLNNTRIYYFYKNDKVFCNQIKDLGSNPTMEKINWYFNNNYKYKH